MPQRSQPAPSPRPAQPPVTVLRSALLAELPWLVHGFSTRAGGTTTAYGGQGELNLATSTEDAPEHLAENRRRFVRAVTGAPAGAWQWAALKQIHSAVIWQDPQPGAAGDGLITAQPGKLLTIRVADCVPILIVDARRRAIAAVHAGWRGTVQRIAEKAVGEMRAQLGCEPADLRAAIGPSIRSCCYEVGDEVVETVLAQFAYGRELLSEPEPDPLRQRYPMLFMTGAPPGHPYDPRWNRGTGARLDLAEANRRQLVAAGLPAAAVDLLPFCTSCRADLFFSHRRDAGHTGRMAAAIGRRAEQRRRAPGNPRR